MQGPSPCLPSLSLLPFSWLWPWVVVLSWLWGWTHSLSGTFFWHHPTGREGTAQISQGVLPFWHPGIPGPLGSCLDSHSKNLSNTQLAWTSVNTQNQNEALSFIRKCKNPPANAGDPGSIPGSGRCPEEGNGISLQYSCLGNPIDKGAWWATVHGVAESDTTYWLNNTTKGAQGTDTGLPHPACCWWAIK